MGEKMGLAIVGICFWAAGMTLITMYSNWQTALGVLLFGWSMNIGNKL